MENKYKARRTQIHTSNTYTLINKSTLRVEIIWILIGICKWKVQKQICDAELITIAVKQNEKKLAHYTISYVYFCRSKCHYICMYTLR